MRVKVEGVKQTRKAIRQFAPDLNKELNRELRIALAPIAKKARGFVPSDSPMSGWAGRSFSEAKFPMYNASTIRSGIGFTTKQGRTTKSGFTSNATIFNKSVAGAIYETAGRVQSGQQGRSNNPQAGQLFIGAMGSLYGKGPERGRLIFKAWEQDQGKATLAVAKAIDKAVNTFNAVGGAGNQASYVVVA